MPRHFHYPTQFRIDSDIVCNDSTRAQLMGLVKPRTKLNMLVVSCKS